MNFTLSDCMQRINQILNYPALAYEDISHFFDHAIAELNTSLRISLPTVSEMVLENTVDVLSQNNSIVFDERPASYAPIPTVKPEAPEYNSYYFEPGTLASPRRYYVWNGVSWDRFDTLYGVHLEKATRTTYVTVPIGNSAYWVETPERRVLEFDLCKYLPFDWWVLFMIPYVCFKYAIRNGDSGALYSDEFTQGFQQLQSSYDVPNAVVLSTVAGLEAYTKIVQDNLDNLSVKVPTRAITEKMKIGNAVHPVYGNLYDTGGWGV